MTDQADHQDLDITISCPTTGTILKRVRVRIDREEDAVDNQEQAVKIITDWLGGWFALVEDQP